MEPEFVYLVFQVAQIQKSDLEDELNNFDPDELPRATEIYQKWDKLGCPSTFAAFQTTLKGKARPVSPSPSRATGSNEAVKKASLQPVRPAPSNATTPVDQSLQLRDTALLQFALSKGAVKHLEETAKACAGCSVGMPKTSSTSTKYQALKGTAKERVVDIINWVVQEILDVSAKCGTDPTAATKLFWKKLKVLSSLVWDMWQINAAVERAGGRSGHDGRDELENESEINSDNNKQAQPGAESPFSPDSLLVSLNTTNLFPCSLILTTKYRCLFYYKTSSLGRCATVQAGERLSISCSS